jgi:riboflavin kinase / FMN adenylyltransferase
MQIYTDLTTFSESFSEPKTSICIGNFDGLHLGHQRVIRSMAEEAHRSRLLSLVLTFQSNTRRWKDTVCLLSSFDEKVAQIRKWGVDALLTLPFPGYIAAQSPRVFVLHVLKRRLGMQACYVGENFRFGKDRKGSVDFLRLFSERLGFSLHVSEMLQLNTQTISSSLIRSLIHQGKVEELIPMLGRPYEMEGLVIKGHGRGKQLGFPTANTLPLDSLKCLPANGIYATISQWEHKDYLSLTHIGPQPTFQGMRSSIETHIPGFDQHIYQRSLRIKFLKRIRDIYSFNTADALKQQIQRDIDLLGTLNINESSISTFLLP